MKLISPCHQNYSSMRLMGEGRYCSECSKVVIDFRKMNDEEIKVYFHKHTGEQICGRAKSYQINNSSSIFKKISNLKDLIRERINFTPLKLALLAILSSLLTFTTSCMGAMRPIDKETPPAKDTIQTSKKEAPIKK